MLPNLIGFDDVSTLGSNSPLSYILLIIVSSYLVWLVLSVYVIRGTPAVIR